MGASSVCRANGGDEPGDGGADGDEDDDVVRVLDGEADRELYGWAMVSDNDESPIREVAVNYGDHTIVRYSAPSNLLSGVYGDIPDFSAQVDITVWTDGAEARPDYWRDAWFALNANAEEPCRESRVRVLSAYDEFQDFDHGAFVFALLFAQN